MAVRTRNSRSAKNEPVVLPLWRRLLARYFPAWVLLAFILFSLLPTLIVSAAAAAADAIQAAPGAVVDVGEFAVGAVITVAETGVDVAGDVLSGVGDIVGGVFSKSDSGGQPEEIAALFTDQVDYWAEDIERWAEEYSLDPNLLATVMQIESCGHPNVASHAGAQGLFQVMPMHFATGEVMVDPDTNAMRGAGVLNYCLGEANGDAGLAMACYNGGPRVLWTPFDQWHNEPQRYYVWGSGIYADAQKDNDSSSTLSEWLNAGGVSLCNRASSELGLS